MASTIKNYAGCHYEFCSSNIPIHLSLFSDFQTVFCSDITCKLPGNQHIVCHNLCRHLSCTSNNQTPFTLDVSFYASIDTEAFFGGYCSFKMCMVSDNGVYSFYLFFPHYYCISRCYTLPTLHSKPSGCCSYPSPSYGRKGLCVSRFCVLHNGDDSRYFDRNSPYIRLLLPALCVDLFSPPP